MGIERHLLTNRIVGVKRQLLQILLRRILVFRDVPLGLIIIHAETFVKSIGVGLPIVGRGTGYFRHIIGHGTIQLKGRFQSVIHGFPNLPGIQIRTFQRFRTDDGLIIVQQSFRSVLRSMWIASHGTTNLPRLVGREHI